MYMCAYGQWFQISLACLAAINHIFVEEQARGYKRFLDEKQIPKFVQKSYHSQNSNVDL